MAINHYFNKLKIVNSYAAKYRSLGGKWMSDSDSAAKKNRIRSLDLLFDAYGLANRPI